MDLESAQDWVPADEYIDDAGDYKPAFVVDSDQKAAWALRKYHAALAKTTQAEELAEVEMRRIDAWLENRRHVNSRDIDFFGGLLSRYALEQREAFDRKTIDLPDGLIQTRTVNEKFVVEDRDAFVAWAKENAPELLRTTYGADMSKIGEKCVAADQSVVDQETGMVIPGIRVEPGRVSANIKVN